MEDKQSKIEIYKTRLVAKGCPQKYRFHHIEAVSNVEVEYITANSL